MKLSCKTSDFLSSLQLAARAISSHQSLPILGNILLEAKGNLCTVSGTDLELSIISQFPAAIESEGSVTVPAKAILNFAQYNTDTEVLLELQEGTQLKCTSKHAKTVLSGESSENYPRIGAVDQKESFTIEATPLLEALRLVTFTSAKTTLRPVLSGVFLRLEGKEFILVATDSYRLSEYRIPASGDISSLSCIIPVKVLDEVRSVLSSGKVMEKEEGKEGEEKKMTASPVRITLGTQQVEISIGSHRFLSRLIEGKFPDYQQIIPQSTTVSAALSTHELLTNVRRMHYFAKEVNNSLTFHFTPSNVEISTPQTPLGKDEATIQSEGEGEGKIALSSSYLLDFLSHIEADTVVVRMTDSLHPAIFKLPSQESFLHLIMPLRLP